MQDSIRIMLDPSLFADNSYKSTFEMISERRDEIEFNLPNSFKNLLLNNQLIEEEHVREFFSSYSSFYDYEDVVGLIETAELKAFSAENYVGNFRSIYQSISATVYDRNNYSLNYGEGDYLADVLFDEFMFSIHNSPILTRLKRTPRAFRNAVVYTVEISEQALDENWENLQYFVGGKFRVMVKLRIVYGRMRKKDWMTTQLFCRHIYAN